MRAVRAHGLACLAVRSKRQTVALWVSLVLSLGVMPAEINANASEGVSQKGLVGTSSPEEVNEWSQPNLSSDAPSDTSFAEALLGRSRSALRYNKLNDDSQSGIQTGPVAAVGSVPSSITFQGSGNPQTKTVPLSPLLTEGVFPYQSNPVAALISAGLTLAVMSLRETGKVDLDGILFLLNSTDFYAGLAGSISGSTGQSAGKSLVTWLGRSLGKASPEMLQPLAQKEAFKVIGNIVNGFTYTFSVSAGYEVFSQFWKIATKNIPEAHTMTGFFGSPGHVRKRVLLNLLYYTTIDKNLQKKVMDSIYYHRVMTFEFIAMNVGLYVGAQLGNFLAKKYAPGNVWAERLGPVAGSVAGGLLVQLIPDSWKIHFNQGLLNWKIEKQKSRLSDLKATLSRGVRQLQYPDHSESGFSSYWMSGVDLSDDVERVFATRDLLASLLMQQALGKAQGVQPWSDMGDSYREVQSLFESELQELSKPEPTLESKINEWIKENKSPSEIQQLSIHEFNSNPKRAYYQLILDEALGRAKEAIVDFEGLQAALRASN